MSLPSKFPEQGYERIASALDCDMDFIVAVSIVEDARRRPEALRLEKRYWRRFRMATRGAQRFDGRKNHRHMAKRWEQFHEMDAQCQRDAILNPQAGHAAILCHSFGAFQIMGFNHRHCGFEDPREFYEAMRTIDGQVMTFVNFILDSDALTTAVRSRNAPLFAHHYNGPRHNRYDRKIIAALKSMGVNPYA